nr:MAG TPA: hypothetical protein [Caudoviricetes sp.]
MRGIWSRIIPRLSRIRGRNHRLLPRETFLEPILGTV